MMIRDFHMRPDYALDQLPICQALALAAFNYEANPYVKLERVSDGYIAQERFKHL
jgi:hypothetical protein